MQYEKTGYLGGRFLNDTPNGQVLNFYVYSGGYMDRENNKYVPYRFPFEAWMEDLIVKIRKLPKKALVTVRFSMIPKEKNVAGVRIDTISLKVDSITHWPTSQKGDRPDDPYVQMQFELLPEQGSKRSSVFEEDSDE